MNENNSTLPWDEYYAAGRARADQLGNRGPVRCSDGMLAEDIIQAYRRHGFYVFTGVIGAAETAELVQDLNDLIDTAPITRAEAIDKHGRPSPATLPADQQRGSRGSGLGAAGS